MIKGYIGKNRRGEDYDAMLFREVYQFIIEAPSKLVELFLESVENNENEKALVLMEKFLNIEIPDKIKRQMTDAIKNVYEDLMGEPDVQWEEPEWALVEGEKKYDTKHAFIPREIPYGMGKGKGLWKSTKHPKIKHTGV